MRVNYNICMDFESFGLVFDNEKKISTNSVVIVERRTPEISSEDKFYLFSDVVEERKYFYCLESLIIYFTLELMGNVLSAMKLSSNQSRRAVAKNKLAKPVFIHY